MFLPPLVICTAGINKIMASNSYRNLADDDEIISLIYDDDDLWEKYTTTSKFLREEQFEEFVSRSLCASRKEDTNTGFFNRFIDIYRDIMFRREREMTFWEYYNYIMRHGKVKKVKV